MKKICLLSFLFLSLTLFAQEKSLVDSIIQHSKKKNVEISPALPDKEKEIKKLFDKILTEDTHDSTRIAINEEIRQKMAEALKEKGSFLFHFDSLKNLGKVYSDDYNLRVYTWCCEMEDLSYRFYGFVQDFDNETVYPLVQNAPVYLPAEDRQILLNRWYGALYYKVINVQKGDEPKYIMLGWTQLNPKTKAKVMEVFSFEDEGKVMLGSKIFKGYKGKANRFTFNYCSDLSVTLNYDEKLKRFVFDHLTPLADEKDNPRGCNGPDMSYDALKQKKKNWFSKKRIWVLKKDVDVRNDK
ncbi:MAG: hypothetical protein P4L28_03165 [Paludibacteraceae bacterium]|nr:hypothetical protein [Paludibacteraceae bacterium]